MSLDPAHLSNIPDELKALQNWVTFDITPDGKKVPYIANSDSMAASNRSRDWRSYRSALKDVESGKRQHLGFCFSESDPYVFIDLDDPDDDDQKRVLERIDSYAQKSISGHGVHIICQGNFNGSGKHPAFPAAGLFKENRFCLMTGDVLDGRSTIKVVDDKDLQSLHSWLGGGHGHAEIELVEYKPQIPDQTVFDMGCHRFTKFTELCCGRWEQFDEFKNDHSTADHAFIAMLCDLTESNDQVRWFFGHSGMWNEERALKKAGHGFNGYVDRTIRKIRSSQAREEARNKRIQLDFSDDGSVGIPTKDAQPFPMHCLPSIAGAMAREIVRVTTSSNEPLAAASILGILSASIGAGLEISTGGERRTRANLYLLAIAESGTGKGESYKLAAEPFEEAETRAIEKFDTLVKPGFVAELKVAQAAAKNLCSKAVKECTSSSNRSIEDFKRNEEKCAELQKKLDSSPHWKVADATKEALAVIIEAQPGEAVASLSSEARGIFSIVKGRYGKEGGDEDFYCSAYSGDSLTVDRIGRDRVILRRPCLAILWMVQPDAAKKAFSDESFTTSGLLPRFLIFDTKAEPKERSEQPDPILPKIKAAWGKLVQFLAKTYREAGDTPREIQVSQEANSLFRDYENENVRRRQSTGDLTGRASFVARWTENAWRLALVLHAAKEGRNADKHILAATTASDAIEIMRWFSEQQLDLITTGRHEVHKARLLALLATLATGMNGSMKFRELRRNHRFEEDEIRNLVRLFPDKLKIVPLRAGGKKPSFAVEAK